MRFPPRTFPFYLLLGDDGQMKPNSMGITELRKQLANRKQELEDMYEELAVAEQELKQFRKQSQSPVTGQLQSVCLCGPLQMGNDNEHFICSFCTEFG